MNIEYICRATPLQEGIYFHNEYAKADRAYAMQLALELEGIFDLGIFEQSLAQITARHEALRSNFVYLAGSGLRQVIYKQWENGLIYCDYSTSAAGAEQWEQLVGKEYAHEFDLGKGSLFRVTVAKLGERRHGLMMMWHHIILDGWSFAALTHELFGIYRSLAKGEAPRLRKPWPLSNYARWLGAKDLAAVRRFWAEYLAGHEKTSLPGWGMPADGKYEACEHRLALGEELTRQIRDFTAGQQVTESTFLQTAWGVVLQRYQGTQDVVYGNVISGRAADCPGIEHALGLFINTVPVRFRDTARTSFREALARRQEEALECEAMGILPLTELQEEGKPVPIDHLFVFENYPVERSGEAAGVDELRVSKVRARERTNYNLDLTISSGRELTIKLTYNGRALSEKYVERLGRHYQQVIREVVEAPLKRIGEIDFLEDAEKRILLKEFNPAEVERPKDRCVHELFEEQARRRPKAIAVVHQGEQLTYGELNGKANQLARRLHLAGVKGESLVGILADRSLEMIVAVMGVFKAGGAYVPIDPDYPKGRIEYMLKDSGCRVLLTRVRRMADLDYSGQTIDLAAADLYEGEANDLEPAIGSRNLAYMIYTSGSLGRPKGVMIEHHSLAKAATAWQRGYGARLLRGALLQTASFSFDVFTGDLVRALTNGGRLILCDGESRIDPKRIVELIARHRVSVFESTPAMMSPLIDHIVSENKKVAHLKLLISGSDVLSSDGYRKQVAALDPAARVLNSYGTTETTIDSCYFEQMTGSEIVGTTVPIGRPMANTHLYVMDGGMHVLPIGISGELCIAGEQLARGYWRRPDLTAEKFIANPYAEGKRLYRTGDLARWLPDGNVEFLGRMDNQVKIRGHRIELGEVESALREHGGIGDAVVLARAIGESGEKSLCAYYVERNGPLAIAGLREHLLARLPGHMVPSCFVKLGVLPLTPNGKIDRKSLPEPGAAANHRVYSGPRNEVEEKLVKVLGEVLGVEKVGIDDSFFELGGHSLKAIRAVAQARKELEVELELKELFALPTVRGLAELVKGRRRLKYETIPRAKVRAYYPVSSAQRRMYALQQLGGGTAYNISGVYVLDGKMEVRRVEQAIRAVIARHEALRTRFELRNGEVVQRVEAEVDFNVEYREEPGAQAGGLMREFVRPFDLGQAPLLRVMVVKRGKDEHVLCMDLHHIISDLVSSGLLIRDFEQAYAGQELKELPLQYKDYAVWQQARLAGKYGQRQAAYWLKQFEGEVPVLNLPTDYPRPALQSFAGARQTHRLDERLSAQVSQFCEREGITLFMFMLAAYQVLLARYSGQEDIVVGTPVMGRDHPDLEEVMGIFVNTVALRGQPRREERLLEYMKEVKRRVLEGVEHQGYPFEELVEKVSVARDLSRSPLFETMFVLVNGEGQPEAVGDIKVRREGFESTTTRFDLSLIVQAGGAGLAVTLEYATRLFRPETIEQLGRHYERVIREAVRAPDRTIGEIEILGSEEKRMLLQELNATGAEYPKDRLIHELFEEQARLRPEAVAVVHEGEQLTYAELNAEANALARRLRKEGVQADSLVGLLAGRSLEMIVGILGVLKAGGAYVPIDPEYPKERIEHMLGDSGCRVLLRNVELPEGMEFNGAVVDLGTEESHAAESGDLAGAGCSGDLAYVIYTSGSTGKAKGVCVEHRNLVNYILGMGERLGWEPGLAHASVSTVAADLGNTVIFGALAGGGCLHVVSYECSTNGSKLAEYLARERIDVLKIVPSHLMALQGERGVERVFPRRHLILGGEASLLEWIERMRAQGGTCAVHNHYGPTETTVGVLTYDVGNVLEPTRSGTLPLGRPLPNARIYIVDRCLQPVPIGVAGELCIGGHGVARGYLRRGALTAERFVADPFGPEAGGRLYRTGDSARYLASGEIEFLGRRDDQVKVRGYRIEPGEIEAILREHPGVLKSVALAREAGKGDVRITAYIVPRDHGQAELAGRPVHMLPNGLRVAHLNRNETEYIYREIFVLQAYLRHGIRIRDGDCIVDAGANIGLFTVFASQVARNLRLLAFEPNPVAFERLEANARAHGRGVKCFPVGLSDRNKAAEMTFFEGFSLLSGFYADAAVERDVVRKFALNQSAAAESQSATGEFSEQIDHLLDDRFKARRVEAKLRTLSSVIEEEALDQIDLLKINVEKSELDVLRGIKAADWRRIRQMVIEVDQKKDIGVITSLLEQHEYEILIEQDALLNGTELCYVYAIRPSAAGRLVREQQAADSIPLDPIPADEWLTPAGLREYAGRRLPSPMIPSCFVLLKELPLTANGKVDRKKLPEPEEGSGHGNYTAPRNEVEESVAQLFAKVLRVKRVGIDDNFFELGGHSLKAIRVVAQARKELEVELELKELFARPTVRGLAETVKGRLRLKYEAIPRVEGRECYPVSSAQRRMYALQQLDGGTAYNIPGVYVVQGGLELGKVEAAIRAVIGRHEALRTRFELRDGEVVQRVEATVNFAVEHREETGVQSNELMHEFVRPFDLGLAPLLRVMVVKRGEGEHVLCMDLHHIVSDLVSSRLLIRDFAQAYAGRELKELPVQYKDYAVWQQERLAGEYGKRQAEYWLKQFEGEVPVLNLPTDYPRPALQSFAGARQTHRLDQTLSAQARQFCEREGVTLYMLFLAAYQVLLAKYSGQEDIVVGTPVMGRDHPDLEEVLGIFVNTLALRSQPRKAKVVRDYLQEMKRLVVAGVEHQGYPFEDLVEQLSVARDLSRNPLFSTMFLLVNAEAGSEGLREMQVRPEGFEAAIAKFDLTVSVQSGAAGMTVTLEYATKLFRAETIERLARHYERAIRAMVAAPLKRIGEIDILGPEEKRQLLEEFNATAADYPKDRCIHELFEEQAKLKPAATAVVYEGAELTYGQLNGKANQLARRLRRAGVGTERLVGILMDRSLEMIIGILSILKAGGGLCADRSGIPPGTDRLHT